MAVEVVSPLRRVPGRTPLTLLLWFGGIIEDGAAILGDLTIVVVFNKLADRENIFYEIWDKQNFFQVRVALSTLLWQVTVPRPVALMTPALQKCTGKSMGPTVPGLNKFSLYIMWSVAPP